MLVIGHDEQGVHCVEVNGSGQVQECLGGAIGARCQSAKTYLEKEYESFEKCTRDELIVHGLKALRDTVVQGKEIEEEGVSIAVVGKEGFIILDAEEIKHFLGLIKEDAPVAAVPDVVAMDTE